MTMRRGSKKVVEVNPYGIIRRILVAAMTGVLPEEHRADAIQLLIEALRAPDDEVRGLAVIGLGEIGGMPNLILPVLADALNDPSELVRRRAIRVISDYGANAGEAVPSLIASLDDPDPAVRLEAVNAIGRIGPVGAPYAGPALMAYLAETNPRFRMVLLVSITRLGPTIIPLCLHLLQHDSVDVRLGSIRILGRLGVRDDSIVESLLELSTTDSSDLTRKAARNVLDTLNSHSRFGF
jgi:HEAT repeat protein